ncbi:phosphoadenosine phosphosulfate reductase domain-containing protein [Legionella jordanis]|nr:phosphoadenosine phosphosulfate reductase family protein [Legionella jordanis]
MHIIIGNFGNHSLAVLQALIEKGVGNVHFVFVDTGWAQAAWSERVVACSEYAKAQGISVHGLTSTMSFADMVKDRKQFPSRKFQWCASFLKGLAILAFLDDFDPSCEALIVSGKRQSDSRRYTNLEEFERDNELYQGRSLWHPLWQTHDEEFIQLIRRTGFPVLNHASLECSPCIHWNTAQLQQLDAFSKARLQSLEDETGLTMFKEGITELSSISACPQIHARPNKIDLLQFDLSCGAPWGCGE